MQSDPGFEPPLGELASALDDEAGGRAPFLTPSFEELLEQLAYAAQFTGGIQVVEGPPASGKTTLASVLRRDYLTQCAHVGALSVSRAPDEALLPRAAAAFGLTVTDGSSAGEAIAVLRSFAQSLHVQSQVAVLLVDDAHLLDQQTLAALASLLQTGGESVFGLHLVLWSEPGLVGRLDDLQLLDVPVHDFVMSTLAPDEIGAFADYLRQHGAVVKVPAAQDLWEVTGGRIGLIKQHLESPPEPVQASARLLKAFGGLPVAHVAALSLLVIVLLWALLAWEPEPEVTTQAVELPTPSVVGPADTAPQADIAETQKQVDPASKQHLDEVGGLQPVIDERELRNAIYGRSEPVEANEPSPANANVPEPEVAQEPVVQPKKESVEAKAKNTQAQPQSQPQPPAQTQPSERYDAGKLLAFDPESYSLQIMAATSVESLERFRAEQPNRTQLYLYRAQRQGRPWYLLMAGNYASRTAAANAIKALPQAQRSGGPWPRKLENVHQEIKEDRRN